MKSRVNLYSDSLLPPELRLSFLHFTRVAALILLFFVAAIGISYRLVTVIESQKSVLTQKKRVLDSEKQLLEAQLAKRVPNPALVAEVDLKARQLELKQMLLGKLSQKEALTSQGYSPLMKDLARVADSSIWLSHIQVNENRFIFEGFSSSPQSVPNWIDRLKNTTTLKGHAFASMTMNRGEDTPLSFKLTSVADVIAAGDSQ